MMYGSFADGWGTWMGFGLHGLGMLIFWGVLIVALVLLVRVVAGRPAAGSKEDHALDVVRERYARGELSREQFEEMRDALR